MNKLKNYVLNAEEKKIEYLKNRMTKPFSVWSAPKLTDEEKQKQEKYIKENNLPF